MMFISLGIGTVAAVALIVVVSILTGGAVKPGSPQPTSVLVGKSVKGFAVAGLNGGRLKAPWKSGHASVLIFFASYCGPCQGEMPKVASYFRSHDESPIVVMGVDASDVLSSGRAFVKKDGVTFPIAFDPNDAVTTGIFQFGQIPETVFVTKRGVVANVYYGAIPVNKLASGIAALKSKD
jgi:thiol-disulfide isomerase/thioredoxin